MKITLLYILLFLVSCSSSSKKQSDIIIHDTDIDFPTADTIEFTPRQSFEILDNIRPLWCVKDSVLFVEIYNNPDRLGICYSINSGKEISTIINIGRAANEANTSCSFKYGEDSIHFCDNIYHNIKTFAINDIISKPMWERPFSINMIPDSLISSHFTKIDTITIFGTNSNLNQLSYYRNYLYYTYDGKDLSFFGEVRREAFETQKDYEESVKEKCLFQTTKIATNKNRVIIANIFGIALHVVDPHKKKIIKERYYNTYKYNPSNARTFTTSKYQSCFVLCSDEYVYCVSQVKDEKKSAEMDRKIFENHIFVFDWDLNPIRKYFFVGNDKINLSHDGKSLYRLVRNNENDEKRDLLEYKL